MERLMNDISYANRYTAHTYLEFFMMKEKPTVPKGAGKIWQAARADTDFMERLRAQAVWSEKYEDELDVPDEYPCHLTEKDENKYIIPLDTAFGKHLARNARSINYNGYARGQEKIDDCDLGCWYMHQMAREDEFESETYADELDSRRDQLNLYLKLMRVDLCEDDFGLADLKAASQKPYFWASGFSDLYRMTAFIDLIDDVASSADYGTGEEPHTVLYDGPAGKIVMPHTKDAAIFWGQQTKWCIAATIYQNEFNTYNAEGPVFMYLPRVSKAERKKEPDLKSFKYAWADNQLWNEQDRPLKRMPEHVKRLIAEASEAMPQAYAGYHEAYGCPLKDDLRRLKSSFTESAYANIPETLRTYLLKHLDLPPKVSRDAGKMLDIIKRDESMFDYAAESLLNFPEFCYAAFLCNAKVLGKMDDDMRLRVMDLAVDACEQGQEDVFDKVKKYIHLHPAFWSGGISSDTSEISGTLRTYREKNLPSSHGPCLTM